ncbi:MAG: DNA-deoxyinosine glycosylase [Xanthomonadales bacterium]|nr:DNA-deoxyinosine glycosylase [Xanthomonadales bacterium]
MPRLDQGFPPIAGPGARCLVLGSMPSRRSLAEHRYYAHPRNAFWPIMGKMLGFDPGADYATRSALLVAHGVAVWDVIARCHRPGSMDADIDKDSLEVNDFQAFFKDQTALRAVFFNGQKAAQVFAGRVAPRLDLSPTVAMETLPSTSPANARLDFDAKYRAWRAALAPQVAQRDRQE